mmetsp:Transcript_122821/g.262111  ORF Transcript_122821/g.262111 Transcript_122821/m.262111 type:complete len:190 (-) Transcript_122821:152-721(-)
MFAEHLAECRALAAQAGEELKKVRTAPETERSAISAGAFGLLKQADDNLQSLQMEARSAPAAERAALAREEAALRQELQAIAKELDQTRRDLLLGPNSGGNTERLFLAREERKRAGAVTDSLGRGVDRLKETNRQAAETEKIGIETLQELRKQREVIMHMKDNTHDLGANLNEAQRAVKELEKPQCTMM